MLNLYNYTLIYKEKKMKLNSEVNIVYSIVDLK